MTTGWRFCINWGRASLVAAALFLVVAAGSVLTSYRAANAAVAEHMAPVMALCVPVEPGPVALRRDQLPGSPRPVLYWRFDFFVEPSRNEFTHPISWYLSLDGTILETNPGDLEEAIERRLENPPVCHADGTWELPADTEAEPLDLERLLVAHDST